MPKQTMTVRFEHVGVIIKARAVDGQDLPDWQAGPIMAEYLRHLRRDGWRLVALPSADCALLEREPVVELRRGRVAQFFAAHHKVL